MGVAVWLRLETDADLVIRELGDTDFLERTYNTKDDVKTRMFRCFKEKFLSRMQECIFKEAEHKLVIYDLFLFKKILIYEKIIT